MEKIQFDVELAGDVVELDDIGCQIIEVTILLSRKPEGKQQDERKQQFQFHRKSVSMDDGVLAQIYAGSGWLVA